MAGGSSLCYLSGACMFHKCCRSTGTVSFTKLSYQAFPPRNYLMIEVASKTHTPLKYML